jgi:hypothetical protein
MLLKKKESGNGQFQTISMHVTAIKERFGFAEGKLLAPHVLPPSLRIYYRGFFMNCFSVLPSYSHFCV